VSAFSGNFAEVESPTVDAIIDALVGDAPEFSADQIEILAPLLRGAPAPVDSGVSPAKA
jgi:hypothetical protein